VTEYQVTYWRELPSLVVARDGERVSKSPLAARFQAAIDEAAMRLGQVGSDDYLAGWRRGEWTTTVGEPADVVERVVAELEEAWPHSTLVDYLDALGPRPSD
jgi:Virulence factor